jgi:hypothetical protein
MLGVCRTGSLKPVASELAKTTRRKWDDNIRMELRETGWESMDLFCLVQDRDQWRALMNTVMDFGIP